ncbi:putative multidrug resistance ABC transporter ATP-binding/permease protein YheI [Alicyclobacillus contaminans]|uniref:ABC transporter ATP-binding protein n=1 Tax=Alicyclobacillus contaminans TaxID=392016 RepID=UPI000425EA4D|nr:ABC transporter transmembrane domain-containing protein [Alicyclobacillus contaminans]GMA49802.1 putative multidrug resistance ABC transporter ATP-binding/permease protein YheI [Alicyclobacillus contaminans]
MFSVLGKLLWFFRQHSRRYSIALGLLFILNFVEVAPPKLVGNVIDAMNQGTLTPSKLFVMLALYALLAAASYSMGFTWQYQLYGGSYLLQRTFRLRLVQHFLRMTAPFFECHRSGDLMALATNDVTAVSQTVGFGMMTLVDATTYSATILLTMGMLISWKLTLLSLLPMPVIAVAVTKYGSMVHRRFTLAQDAFGSMNNGVLETISGIRVLRAYVQERRAFAHFQEIADDVYQKNVAVAKIDAMFEPTIKLLVGISYLIGLGYGTDMVFHSQLTLGELTAFNVYLGMLIWPMLAIGELMNTMQRGNASLDRIEQTLAYPPDVTEAPTPVSVSAPDSIVFRHVTFRYPLAAHDSLRDVSVHLRRGQTLGVVGRTGSGKSTLLKQLLREYPLGDGEILLGGVPIEQIPLDQLRNWLGYVPQEAMLFSRTVADNVRFAAPNAPLKDVLAALWMAGFREDLAMLPNGVDTLVGERGVSLSGGQKQRIALARALIKDPEILILDDALSAVDARTEAHILMQLRACRKGRTTLIASHRLSAVEHADWIIVLDDGRVVEEGPHVHLVGAGGWYQAQYERQQVEQAMASDLESGDVEREGGDGE